MQTKETLSEQSKRRIVSEVLSGKYSKEQARRLYGIKSKSGILEWMRIFAGESGKSYGLLIACLVFTVPDKLHTLFLHNKKQMYNLLFRTVNEVMQEFGNTEKWIGGQIGMTAILHTWGQNLQYHPHLHLIVPAGALMKNGKWKHARNRGKWLF